MKNRTIAQKWIDKFDVNKVLNLIKEGVNITDISFVLQIPKRRMYELCDLNNISRETYGHKIHKNNHFFEKIDSEIKAYLLGYVLADGCVLIEPKKRNGKIYSYSKRLCFTVSVDDREVINLLKENIAPTSLIKEFHNNKGAKNRKRSLLLRISSSKIVDDLIKLNIKPKKTYDITFKFDFDKLDKSLHRHFIRGFFDGDGWIGTKNQCVGFVSTSKDFLLQLEQIIKNNIIDCKTKITEAQSKNMKYYKLNFTSFANSSQGSKKRKEIRQNLTTSLYNYFYKNSNYYLQRKKIKFNIENIVLTN